MDLLIGLHCVLSHLELESHKPTIDASDHIRSPLRASAGSVYIDVVYTELFQMFDTLALKI